MSQLHDSERTDTPVSIRLFPVLVVVALALPMSGCGSSSSGTVARPQTVKLDWHENCGTRADPIPIATRSLVVEKGVWRVALSFRNRTRITLFITRPHFPGSTYFGLEPFRTASRREVVERAETGAGAKPRTIADRFSPPLPRLLPPGRGWSGEFTGRAALPAGSASGRPGAVRRRRATAVRGLQRVPLHLGEGRAPELIAIASVAGRSVRYVP
jgi:hypothetical protein